MCNIRYSLYSINHINMCSRLWYLLKFCYFTR